MKRPSKESHWLLAIAFAMTMTAFLAPQAHAGLKDAVPMSNESWSDVSQYVDDINSSYPAAGLHFKYSRPQKMISERTAVETLDSVRDSLVDQKGFEPWIFQHINLMCGLPCDGT